MSEEPETSPAAPAGSLVIDHEADAGDWLVAYHRFDDRPSGLGFDHSYTFEADTVDGGPVDTLFSSIIFLLAYDGETHVRTDLTHDWIERGDDRVVRDLSQGRTYTTNAEIVGVFVVAAADAPWRLRLVFDRKDMDGPQAGFQTRETGTDTSFHWGRDRASPLPVRPFGAAELSAETHGPGFTVAAVHADEIGRPRVHKTDVTFANGAAHTSFHRHTGHGGGGSELFAVMANDAGTNTWRSTYAGAATTIEPTFVHLPDHAGAWATVLGIDGFVGGATGPLDAALGWS